jgi:hypothetical protein
LSASGDSPIQDRNYLVRRIGIEEASVRQSDAVLRLGQVELESMAMLGSVSWEDRWQRVLRIHSRRFEFPDDMSQSIASLVAAVFHGGSLTPDVEALVLNVMRSARELRPGYDGLSDVLPVLESILGLGSFGPVLEVEEVREETAAVAGRKPSGQGFRTSTEHRRVVELHAMVEANAHFGQMWTSVTDVSATESYDLLCRSEDGTELRVEVKGTTSTGSAVLLTPNEVVHARSQYPNTARFVLSGIVLGRSAEGALTASGGTAFVLQPWVPEDGSLKPTGFEYQLPVI